MCKCTVTTPTLGSKEGTLFFYEAYQCFAQGWAHSRPSIHICGFKRKDVSRQYPLLVITIPLCSAKKQRFQAFLTLMPSSFSLKRLKSLNRIIVETKGIVEINV